MRDQIGDMLRYCGAGLIALAFAASAHAETPATLRIADWNIEHLAENDGQGCKPRTEEDYGRLRAAIATLDADIIAFQEVENEAAARRVFPAETYLIFIDAQTTAPGDICSGTTRPRLAQSAGFAVRRELAPFIERHPDLRTIATDGADPTNRAGVDISVNIGPPLRLLAVHLKSSCPNRPAETNDACATVYAQARALGAWAAERRSDGHAYAIVGDFNRHMVARDQSFLRTISDAAGEPLVTADAGALQTCPGRYVNTPLIDHFVLDNDAAARRSGIRWREVPLRGTPTLSDHCPSLLEVTQPALPEGLQWLRTSAEYDALTVQTYRAATAALPRHGRSANRWPWSQARPWAVALDIDETILDNSQYEVETFATGYNSETWRTWVEREQAGLIAPAATFVRAALDRGPNARVVLVTNRRAEQAAATRNNLVAHDEIFADRRVCILGRTDVSDKNPRWHSVERGEAAACAANDNSEFRFGAPQIEFWVGDNIEDFPCLNQQTYRGARPLPDTCASFAQRLGNPEALIGDRFFVLPNPNYGSWEFTQRRHNAAPQEINSSP